MTDFTATTSPAIFETNGSTNTWRVSNVGIQGEVGDLPTQTGNGGAVLGTNGTATSWVRHIGSPDGKSRVVAEDGTAWSEWADGDRLSTSLADDTGAEVFATNGTATAQVRANQDGTVEIVATGAATLNSHDLVVDTDARLTDSRTPTAHAASHGSAGTDPVTVAESQVTGLVSDLATISGVANGAIPKSLADAKGDLLVATADNTVTRLPVGTNGQTLVADSSESSGVKWATPSAGSLNLDDLGDVSTSGAANNDILKYNSGTSTWGPAASGTPSPILSGTFTTASSVSQDAVLDGAYEYELVIHETAVGTGTPQLNFRGRASGADVTSSSYYLAGWAKSWTGGLVGWGASAVATLPLHYQGTSNLVTRLKLIQDTSTRWIGTIDSVAQSTGIACQGNVMISAAIDGFTFYPASSTITGDWALYRRFRT